MRSLLALPALVLVAACGTSGGTVATDEGGTPSPPRSVPAAPGEVHTRGLVTVLDTGAPQLCLGAVAESMPPQCSGVPLAGWDWTGSHGLSEHRGAARWGLFAVSGRWDGSTFTVDGAVPSALFDAAKETPTSPPLPAVDLREARLQGIADEVRDRLPGVQGVAVEGVHVVVDVVYDDGSLQAWCDATYGKDVVLVRPALVDEG